MLDPADRVLMVYGYTYSEIKIPDSELFCEGFKNMDYLH
jgi:hypothetical protein